MASTIYLVMAMPRPVPSIFCTRALSSRAKESKIWRWNSSDMPMPVSCTRKWQQTRSAPAGLGCWYSVTVMRPASGVNLTALDSRLSST